MLNMVFLAGRKELWSWRRSFSFCNYLCLLSSTSPRYPNVHGVHILTLSGACPDLALHAFLNGAGKSGTAADKAESIIKIYLLAVRLTFTSLEFEIVEPRVADLGLLNISLLAALLLPHAFVS